MPSPGCVHSHALGVCVCVGVFVCPHVPGRWMDATMHRFIDAFVDSPIQPMPRFILRFINVSNASDVVVFLSSSGMFQFIVQLFCQSRGWFWSHFVSPGVHCNVILVSAGVFWRPCGLQGSPGRARVENVSKKVVRGSTPGPPKSTENLSKSMEISSYVCVSACECVFYAQGVVKGGWICSNHSK